MSEVLGNLLSHIAPCRRQREPIIFNIPHFNLTTAIRKLAEGKPAEEVFGFDPGQYELREVLGHSYILTPKGDENQKKIANTLRAAAAIDVLHTLTKIPIGDVVEYKTVPQGPPLWYFSDKVQDATAKSANDLEQAILQTFETGELIPFFSKVMKAIYPNATEIELQGARELVKRVSVSQIRSQIQIDLTASYLRLLATHFHDKYYRYPSTQELMQLAKNSMSIHTKPASKNRAFIDSFARATSESLTIRAKHNKRRFTFYPEEMRVGIKERSLRRALKYYRRNFPSTNPKATLATGCPYLARDTRDMHQAGDPSSVVEEMVFRAIQHMESDPPNLQGSWY